MSKLHNLLILLYVVWYSAFYFHTSSNQVLFIWFSHQPRSQGSYLHYPPADKTLGTRLFSHLFVLQCICLFACLSVHLSVHPSFCLSVCLFVHLFVCLSVRPSFHLSEHILLHLTKREDTLCSNKRPIFG